MKNEKNVEISWGSFLKMLNISEFLKKNEKFFRNYISIVDNGTETAGTHMKISYSRLVLSGQMKQSDFLEITLKVPEINSTFWYDSYVEHQRKLEVQRANKAKEEKIELERIEAQKLEEDKIRREEEKRIESIKGKDTSKKELESNEQKPREKKERVPKSKEKKAPIEKVIKEKVEYDFKEKHKILCEEPSSAQFKIYKNADFILLKGSRLPFPSSSKVLQEKVQNLIDSGIVEQQEEPTASGRGKIKFIVVLKDYKDSSLTNIIQLAIGKVRIPNDNPWAYVENGSQVKRNHLRISKSK